MSCFSNVEEWKLKMDVLIDAADDPGVELAVDEDDVGEVLPVFGEIFSTEGVYNPIEVGDDAVLVSAVLGELG